MGRPVAGFRYWRCGGGSIGPGDRHSGRITPPGRRAGDPAPVRRAGFFGRGGRAGVHWAPLHVPDNGGRRRTGRRTRSCPGRGAPSGRPVGRGRSRSSSSRSHASPRAWLAATDRCAVPPSDICGCGRPSERNRFGTGHRWRWRRQHVLLAAKRRPGGRCPARNGQGVSTNRNGSLDRTDGPGQPCGCPGTRRHAPGDASHGLSLAGRPQSPRSRGDRWRRSFPSMA